MNSGTEQILCISAGTLPKSWLGSRTVLPMDFKAFAAQCARSGFFFADRAQAETDPEKKQIIPYILLQTTDGTETAVYNRKGSETRLHDLWSLGIGGHINPIDQIPADQTTEGHTGHSQNLDQNDPKLFTTILNTGMQRELDEELIQRPCQDTPQFAGIISEQITDVGRVHLGAVFRLLTDTPQAYSPGPELYRFSWIPTPSPDELNMELWSQLALQLIGRS